VPAVKFEDADKENPEIRNIKIKNKTGTPKEEIQK